MKRVKAKYRWLRAGRGRRPYDKRHRGTAIDHAFDPDPAAMALDDFPDRCQSDTGAVIFLDVMQALEWRKQIMRILHIETRAVVANSIDCLPVAPLVADFDFRRAGFGRELP